MTTNISHQFLKEYHLPTWDELPNIDVYMDQLITIVEDAVGPLYHFQTTKKLTPSMVNNYVKLQLIPRPVKKKYQKQHIARLIVITILKQVFDITSIQESIDIETKETNSQIAYDKFCQYFQETLDIFLNSSTQKVEATLYQDMAPIHLACITVISKIFTEISLAHLIAHLTHNQIEKDD